MMRRPASSSAAGGRASPLLLAVQNGHFDLAIALIDAGADPNDQRTGFTPLHMLPGVRKPDSSDGSDGAAPNGAGRLSSLEFVREIVKRGANVNLRLPKGAPRMPATSSSIGTEGATLPLRMVAGHTPRVPAAIDGKVDPTPWVGKDGRPALVVLLGEATRP
jgi:ankyrin repeat protein